MNSRVELLLVICSFALFGCENQKSGFPEGINAHDRLNWYFTSVPRSIKVEQFYESPSPAMDHFYLWKIRLTDEQDFRMLEKQIVAQSSNRDDVGVDTGVITDEYPSWWRAAELTKMEGYKFTGNENGSVYAMFDRKDGFLFLQVLD